MTRLRSEGRGCLSMQVLQEFYNASRRKAKAPTGDVAAEIERLAQLPLQRPDLEDPLAAIRPPEAETISFRDALIVRSALEMGCHFHWTEDLQHGRWFGDLVIRNPFAA
jgi:predicted nucleic acid-binding protein